MFFDCFKVGRSFFLVVVVDASMLTLRLDLSFGHLLIFQLKMEESAERWVGPRRMSSSEAGATRLHRWSANIDIQDDAPLNLFDFLIPPKLRYERRKDLSC